MDGKGGLRERSKTGCVGEMLMRQMQKPCCCSSTCPHIHPSHRGSSRTSNPAMIFHPSIHLHFSITVCTNPPTCLYSSIAISIRPPLRHHYLLPNTTRPPPCTHPASPPSPCPRCVGKRQGAALGVCSPGPPSWWLGSFSAGCSPSRARGDGHSPAALRPSRLGTLLSLVVRGCAGG